MDRAFCGISGLAPSSGCSNAGLVQSDLFNAATYLPTQPDDSLVNSSYVSINGSRYLALPSTPSEFVVRGGFGVSEEFVDRMLGRFGGDATKLFPNNSSWASNVVSGNVFNADNAAPGSVSLTLSGNSMSWSNSGSNDVVGYYVYRSVGNGANRVATISEARENRYSTGAFGSYYVVAVDITGKLSAPSNVVNIARPEPTPPPRPTTPPPATGGGNNGGGNGGGGTTTPPTQPTEPTEPTEPEPTEPTEPSEPVDGDGE